MSDLIPFAHQEKQRRVKAEIQGQKVSVIFDGTNRIGETMAIILRFVDKDWSIQHRLIRLQLLAKSMTGEKIACGMYIPIHSTHSPQLSSIRLTCANVKSIDDN